MFNSKIEHKEKNNILELAMSDHGNDVLYLAYSYVKDHEIAKDITQDVFIKLYNNIEQFRGESTLKTWLFRITSNHCKDYLKSWHYRKVILTNNMTEIFTQKNKTPEHIALLNDEKMLLNQYVLSLPVKYREVIYLFYFEGFSLKEISECLSLNINTVKTRLAKAKELLRKVFVDWRVDYGN